MPEIGRRDASPAGLPGQRPDQQEVLAIEAEILRGEISKRAQEEAGANQQDERNGHLRQDEQLAGAETSTRRRRVGAAPCQ